MVLFSTMSMQAHPAILYTVWGGMGGGGGGGCYHQIVTIKKYPLLSLSLNRD